MARFLDGWDKPKRILSHLEVRRVADLTRSGGERPREGAGERNSGRRRMNSSDSAGVCEIRLCTFYVEPVAENVTDVAAYR